jgi:1,4-alpha-glucan branching enzyme
VPITVHHRPVNQAVTWNIQIWQSAWDGNLQIKQAGSAIAAGLVDFTLPDVADPRQLQFQFYSAASQEPGTMIRRLSVGNAAEVWTFESSPRILYSNPAPAGVNFNPGDILTVLAITRSAYRGGKLHVWDPYNAQNPTAFFPETSRDDTNSVSTFRIVLLPWMSAGFHLKLMKPGGGPNGSDLWEPDTANRVWRPADGASVWLKSGQCDVRNQPLSLTAVSLEMLYSARVAAPPQLTLTDLAENSTFAVSAVSSQPYALSPLFRVAVYQPAIYPGAAYNIASQGLENPPLQRPFPADPTVPQNTSRCALGASAWLAAFPVIATATLASQPQPSSSFRSGLSVDVSVGNGPVFDTQPASQTAGGDWEVSLPVALATTTAFDLHPAAGPEPKPYDWIDTSRYFTPQASTPVLYTTEGIYGITSQGRTPWQEPANRGSLMAAVYGQAAANAGVFASREMPHGATICNGNVYFVVHAPHAVRVVLILVNQPAAGAATRVVVPMQLTRDTFYWWVAVPAAQAGAGTRYRFLLNDDIEILDPAGRAVYDVGGLTTNPGEDPNNPETSWSEVLDINTTYTSAHVHGWQTMGWQNLLIYEMHPRRFSNLQPGTLAPFGIVADELKPVSRLNQTGYLYNTPVTVLGLMPVNEFVSAMGWGYDPSYYFAIDSVFGGAPGLAGLVDAAHASGRGVMLDVVYNHSLGSSLMQIAPDVYRNGDYDGDRMNCGHPMVLELLRQAVVYLFRTFNLDGFRFDDTKTIVEDCVGGWQFLGAIRNAIRGAANADGRPWPYCVAENSSPAAWNISNPAWNAMDGEWGIDESYRIEDSSYATWPDRTDNAGALQTEMNNPSYWGRPFFQATRFGESHDMVSFQNAGNKRIAARPPYGQGYQMAKALGTLTLLSNGIPMLFMGQEYGETTPFYFDITNQYLNPQQFDLPAGSATDNTRILLWFRQIMGLRNDPAKGLQGNNNYQTVGTGNRTVAFTCGTGESLFTVVTFGTPNQQQNSAWLGLPSGYSYKEIFNSSWPAYQVEFETEHSNGGYSAGIQSGQILQLPYIGAVVLEKR